MRARGAVRGWIGTLSGVLFLVFFAFFNSVFAGTTVTSPEQCVRIVTLKIEIFSDTNPKTWTDSELAAMDAKTRKAAIEQMSTHTSYGKGMLNIIAAAWKSEIEAGWNGPTNEQVEEAAEELGVTDAQMDNAAQGGDPALRKKLDDKARAMLKEAGGGDPSCAEVNCCKIYFKVEVKVRTDSDEPTEGYDQIEVMTKGYRSNVSRHADGITSNQKGTTGRWAYDPKDPQEAAAAHESGHLMGEDDRYRDNAEGNSVADEHHESDMMGTIAGWPQEAGIGDILKIAGAECDCCPRTFLSDAYAQDYNMTIVFGLDALKGNNCEHLTTALAALERDLRNLQSMKIPMSEKMHLAGRLQDTIRRVKEAKKNCDPPVTTTGITTGDAGIPTVPFTYDSLECTTFGGGTVPFPIPGYPFLPGNPFFPVGPTEGPAGTPGTTPETPGTTPGSTPGGPQTPATPGSTPENPNQVLIPFGKFEYDDNPTVIRPEGAGDGDDVKTPYDWTIFDERDVPAVGSPDKEQETIVEERKYNDLGQIIEEIDTTEKDNVVTTPIQEEDEPEIYIPTWLVFKVEQDIVQENGTIEKGPAEKSVLKLGFPVPDKPGSGAVRTAEDTNKGASDEPRFVETDDDGWGKIPLFTDGFESGDTSSWGDAGRPESKENKNTNAGTYNVAGFTLDATPMKSRIVYLDARLVKVDDNFLEGIGTDFTWPDDLDGNGIPDWAQTRPDLENEIANESLKLGGISPETTGGSGGDDDKIVPPNVPAGGGTPKTELPEDLKGFEMDRVRFGNTWGVTLGYKYHEEDFVLGGLDDFVHQDNRYLKEKTDDPYYQSAGTWDQPYDDQWAIKSVGFTEGDDGAWAAAGEDLEPVIVAFIDTGIDWNHADISWDNIWINEDEIAGNGIDDDMNGYIDDTIGWDFYTNSASPWDQDGHGTFTAGMVIATQNNGIGIAGINPAAKIMVLKALNDFGHTRASYVSKAIKYATDNGARVINLSIGGEHQTYLEKMAVKYAYDRGVIIVVAAGNEAMEVSEYGFVPYPEVIAVTSSDFEGNRAFFSNLGPEIDIAAPGLDVLSLRARMTDFMRHLKGVPYEAGSSYVGDDKRYFRSSGTSFSAPIITGIASLILSMNPELTNVEVKRMILNSARDVEIPGTDQFTGYGVVDAVAALNADPAFEISAGISGVKASQDETGAFFVNVTGTASANEFAGASVQIGIGEAPTSWKEVATVDGPVTNGALAKISAGEFRAAPTWTIRVVVTHTNGRTREQWYVLELG